MTSTETTTTMKTTNYYLRALAVLVALAVAMSTLVEQARPAQAAFPGANGKIAFESYQDANAVPPPPPKATTWRRARAAASPSPPPYMPTRSSASSPTAPAPPTPTPSRETLQPSTREGDPFLATDQRGVIRPQGAANSSITPCS